MGALGRGFFCAILTDKEKQEPFLAKACLNDAETKADLAERVKGEDVQLLPSVTNRQQRSNRCVEFPNIGDGSVAHYSVTLEMILVISGRSNHPSGDIEMTVPEGMRREKNRPHSALCIT